MNNINLFEGRRLLIATKHGKEQVIAPILESALGVKCVLPSNLDTDVLGTFSGEVDRMEDPITTARKKCLLGIEGTGYDLALSNEGSFGPHPNIPFVQSDDEIMLFMDTLNGIEIVVRVLSTETNFNACEIQSIDELKIFAEKAKFPSHALIMKKSRYDFSDIRKGISTWEAMSEQFNEMRIRHGSVFVETDMRAMCNPTRMSVIEKATQRLADKIKSVCPICNTPGLGITAVKEGLPCELCGKPTHSIISHIYECQKCEYSNEVRYPNQKETEDPMYCNFCNP